MVAHGQLCPVAPNFSLVSSAVGVIKNNHSIFGKAAQRFGQACFPGSSIDNDEIKITLQAIDRVNIVSIVELSKTDPSRPEGIEEPLARGIDEHQVGIGAQRSSYP